MWTALQSRARLHAAATAGLLIGIATPAAAEEASTISTLPDAPAAVSSASASAAPTPKPSAGALTFHGVTLYGVVDVGVAYLNHGAPLSADFSPGLPFVVQKFSDRPTASLAPNGLGQSKLGLSGVEPLGAGVSFVFKLETGFQPTSGKLNDGPASLMKDNGRPLAAYVESSDSARAGQFLQGAAYAGFSSKTFGTLTYGWQTSLMLDDLIKYDPQAQSYAFSVIGYSGVAGGAGDTEDARLGSSLKYTVGHGPARLALLHQFGGDSLPGGSDAVDFGLDLGGFSMDAIWDEVKGAVAASALTAAQNLAHPGTLAAVVSDNTAYSVQAKYAWRQTKLYAGWERVDYANPAHPLSAGVETLGGYTLSVVNNSAFDIHKVLQISWVGLRYAVTPKLDVTGAYYRYDQNSYKAGGCADASAATCSGQLYELSAAADYRLTRHFDVYTGLMTSRVADGLASGYLKTSSTGTMSGVRFSF
jgi:predicted porin